MKIIPTEKYITETGLDVTIVKDNLRGTPWPIVICVDMQDGTDAIDFCDENGMTTEHGQLQPYGSQFKLDEPDSRMRIRHFAYVIDDKIAAWSYGRTSSTTRSSDDVTVWDYGRKLTPEELAAYDE